MDSLQVFLLRNRNEMSVEIINFGARIKSILFPVCGKPTEMTVGYSQLNDYMSDEYYLGATCGRVSNRIENAEFKIAGKQYLINNNDEGNCLHGGQNNFSNKFWDLVESGPNFVTLALESIDGEQGFPGCLAVTVTYILTENNTLEIIYSGQSNKATPISLTNHTYFNLGNETCESLDLQISSNLVLNRKENGLPSGKIDDVDGTDFDFRLIRNIGNSQQDATDEMLKDIACYDHCFLLNNGKNEAKATLTSYENKVKMNVYTDQLAIQLYTGIALNKPFIPYQGVCLEAQNYSNAVNIPHFPERVLQPEDHYRKHIIFEFLSI